MSSLPTIACKDCNHINEGQRIYCHNCGNKLDRSEVLGRELKNEESREKKQQRVKKMMSPGSGLGLGTVKSAFRTLAWAVVAALVINIVRPPEKVPPMPKEALGSAPMLDITLEELSMASAGRQVAFTEEDINLYLQNAVRSKKGQSITTFQRAFVKVEEGSLWITSQTAIQNFPLYAGVRYRLKIENNRIQASPIGIHFGRLQIPEVAASHAGPLLDMLFKSLWGALKRETKLMGEIGSLELKTGQIILHSREARSAATP